MSFVRVYGRVLRLLWPERRLAVALVAGNVGIAGIAFLEPILFGRVIDVLATSTERSAAENWGQTMRLVGIWSVVGAVGIVSSILVALHADRMSHRRKLAAMAQYFEHVLSLQAAFHQREHSGRMLKVMLVGADYVFGFLLSLFREHLSTFLAVLVLLPIALYMNWKMALLLVALLAVFTVVNYVVINKTWRAQAKVEDYNSELAARASDALSNVTLLQSFVRLTMEARDIRVVMQRLLAAQFPVLNLWALVTVLSRMASTITVIGIFVLGSYLHLHGEITVGQIVSFMGFATLLILRLEQATGFITGQFFRLPALRDFFEILDTEPGVRDKPDAIKLGRVKGDIEFDGVTHSYDTARPAVTDLTFSVNAGTSVALVGPTGAGKSTTMALLSRLWDPQSGAIRVDGHDIRDVTLELLRGNIGVVFQDSAVFNRSIAENIRIGTAGSEPGRRRAGRQACPGARLHRSAAARLRHFGRRARRQLERRRASASRDRTHAAQEPAHPDSRRSDERARYGNGIAHPAGAGDAHARAHHLHHRAPSVDSAQGRHHPGAAPGTHRRARPVRRIGCPRRAVRGIRPRAKSPAQPGVPSRRTDGIGRTFPAVVVSLPGASSRFFNAWPSKTLEVRLPGKWLPFEGQAMSHSDLEFIAVG